MEIALIGDHANFFTSGLVGLRQRGECGLPLVVTFHALGKGRAFGRAGIRRVCNEFTWERLDTALRGVYGRLSEPRTAPPMESTGRMMSL